MYLSACSHTAYLFKSASTIFLLVLTFLHIWYIKDWKLRLEASEYQIFLGVRQTTRYHISMTKTSGKRIYTSIPKIVYVGKSDSQIFSYNEVNMRRMGHFSRPNGSSSCAFAERMRQMTRETRFQCVIWNLNAPGRVARSKNEPWVLDIKRLCLNRHFQSNVQTIISLIKIQ